MDHLTGKSGTPRFPMRLIDNPLADLAPPQPAPKLPIIQRIIRLFKKTPRSPVATGADEAHKLKLVPERDLIVHYRALLQYLDSELRGNLGAYLEFGVYNGTSMLCMGAALRRTGLTNIPLVGFDSFKGLPPSAVTEDDGVWQEGQFACPRDVAETRLSKLFNQPNSVQLVEGWYEDTLTSGENYGLTSASLVMIDSDAYSSARYVLRFIGPLLTNPSIIIFDDWELNDLDLKGMGEFKAFHEWIQLYPEVNYCFINKYNRKSRTILLRRLEDR
jgi:O-methyltransferase